MMMMMDPSSSIALRMLCGRSVDALWMHLRILYDALWKFYECSENALRILCGHSAVEPASARYSAIRLKVLWGVLWEYSANALRVLYRGALSAGYSANALGVLWEYSLDSLRVPCDCSAVKPGSAGCSASALEVL